MSTLKMVTYKTEMVCAALHIPSCMHKYIHSFVVRLQYTIMFSYMYLYKIV